MLQKTRQNKSIEIESNYHKPNATELPVYRAHCVQQGVAEPRYLLSVFQHINREDVDEDAWDKIRDSVPLIPDGQTPLRENLNENQINTILNKIPILPTGTTYVSQVKYGVNHIDH